MEKLRIKLLNDNRSRSNKLQYELNTIQRKIDNLLDAVADGTLDKEIVKEKVEKLKKDQKAIHLEMSQGQIIPFPRLNISGPFLERFRCICEEMIMDGDPIKGRTFLKRFIEQITLEKNACKVFYNLAGIIPTNEDGSSLRDIMVERNMIE